MRYREILNEAELSDYLLDELHGPKGCGVWITPNVIDRILPRGQHDQISYGRFREPGDDLSNMDMIPWNARALKNGWIRGRSSKDGTEMNIELCSGPQTAPAIKSLVKLLKHMDMLEQVFVEVHDPANISGMARQMTFDNPRKAVAAISSLAA